LGDLLVLAGGLAFAVAAALTRRVGPFVAGLAALAAVIPPPFFWPAFGVLIILFHMLVTSPKLMTGDLVAGPAR